VTLHKQITDKLNLSINYGDWMQYVNILEITINIGIITLSHHPHLF